MTLGSETCTIRLVSEIGRQLVEADDEAALRDFTRKTLSCPRLRQCPNSDYCTIFSASLLSDLDKHSHDYDEG
ncbi:hypothetical protein A6A04_12835 [Paramagnetospirillum marisnigri]|uniref:Uncharacterized protein n=1 Tax=Paramagnetospirillum marisnigri TaxID=1285242 RepID=A0A178MVK7_9PROT|nr:hypothetical protein [Paramagnetospirillum marisnigri]OAN54120.1 hypothetical protein A6A04_12835 [Paramagnetospirillum marisnigri]